MYFHAAVSLPFSEHNARTEFIFRIFAAAAAVPAHSAHETIDDANNKQKIRIFDFIYFGRRARERRRFEFEIAAVAHTVENSNSISIRFPIKRKKNGDDAPVRMAWMEWTDYDDYDDDDAIISASFQLFGFAFSMASNASFCFIAFAFDFKNSQV